MRLTKEYKWTYYKVVPRMYTILPPEKIRSRCGARYLEKIFPDLKEDLEKLGVDTSSYPSFHPDSESQTLKVLEMINKKWLDFLTEEMRKAKNV